MGINKILLKGAIMIFLVVSLAHAEERRSLYDDLNQRSRFSRQTVMEGPLPDVECPPTVRIGFKAVDAGSGNSIPAFRVSRGFGYFCSENGKLENGIFYLDVQSDNLCRLSITAKNYESEVFRFDFGKLDDETKTKITRGMPDPFIIKLSPAKGSMRGRVLDAITMEPIGNVLVEISGSAVPPITEDENVIDISSGGENVVTAADGSFQIKNLRLKPAGVCTNLYFSAKGYEPKYISIKRRYWQEDLGNILLLRLATVRGVLLNKDKRPLIGETVYLLTPEEFRIGGLHKSTPRAGTDGKGNFMFKEIAPMDYIILYGSSEMDSQYLSLGPAENKFLELTRK